MRIETTPLASPPPQAGKGADRVCGTTSLRLNAALSPHPGGEELFETHRLALARGFARFDPSETARLDEPSPSRRKLPSAFHRLARIPTHRLVLDIHHLVVGIEQLDAVSVGIAQVHEERVTGSMAARPEFDIGGKTHLGREVADIEEMIGLRNSKRGVVQPRPVAGGKDNVVRVAFALQEDEEQILGSVGG